MGATLTTVNQLLKEVYEPDIQEQLQNETVALKRVATSSKGIETTVNGKYVTFPLHTRRNAGLGARNEMEALPTPGQQGFAGARVALKYLYGGVRLSGQTIKLAEKNYQAFTSAMEFEFDGLKNDLAKDQNRQVYGTGNGAVATVVSDGANNAVVQHVLWVQQGMQVDLIDGTTLGNPSPTVKASNRQITAIDPTTNTITYDGADATAAAGDIFVRTGSVNREWSGLGVIIANSGTFQNVDPTLEPTWKATVDSNGGTNRAISESLITATLDKVRAAGAPQPTLILMNLGVRRAYANLLMQQRRYVNVTEFTGGFKGLAFVTDKGDVPMVVDLDCPPNRMYAINENEITLYREADWAFMDEDGARLSRVAGFDAYDATMYQYSQLGTHRRNAHALIADITEG